MKSVGHVARNVYTIIRTKCLLENLKEETTGKT
jgi:hypothetical protein